MLIVTSTDHKARTRPSVRNEPKSKFFPYSDLQLYPLSPVQKKQLTDVQSLAGTLFAVTVIEGLLAYSDSYKSHVRGKRNPINPWPLTPAQASGLHAALYHLQQYIGTLHLEPGG
jgi:hypothetical protein